MNIGGIGSTNSLLKQLEANGLSADKAKLVETDLTAAETTTSPSGAAGAGISPTIRAAFDAKIAADVASGKLSASDAATVGKAFDTLGGQAATATGQGSPGVLTSAQAGGPAGSGGGGDGGDGGGGASSKTELSETITVSGSTMTTVITYTDGTTSTTTTTATDADRAKYAKQPSADTTSGIAGDYVPPIDKGSLVDQVA